MNLKILKLNRMHHSFLDKHFPGLRAKYHQKYGYAYEINSDNNKELMDIFHNKCKENGIVSDMKKCFAYLHEFPEKYEQMTLF